jgi:hypothetical protein
MVLRVVLNTLGTVETSMITWQWYGASLRHCPGEQGNVAFLDQLQMIGEPGPEERVSLQFVIRKECSIE